MLWRLVGIVSGEWARGLTCGPITERPWGPRRILWCPRSSWSPAPGNTRDDGAVIGHCCAGHEVIVVDLPCGNADATLKDYADAVRADLPDDLTQVVLVGLSFGGFTASKVAVDHPDLPLVLVAAWIPRDGSSVLDFFVGGDPFDAGEEAGIAAFDGLVLGAGPGLCALNIDLYVAAADPVERDAVGSYLERTQRPQGIAVLREKSRGFCSLSPTHLHPDDSRHAGAAGGSTGHGSFGGCRGR